MKKLLVIILSLCMVLTFSTTFGFAAESPVQDAAAEAAETPEEATVPETPEAPDEAVVPDEGQPPLEEPAPVEAEAPEEAPLEEPAEEPAPEANVPEEAPEALAPEEETVSQEAADAALPAETKASDKTVESISYTRAIPYVAWLESDFFYDEASGKYYVETTNYSLFNGDTLTVNYSDSNSVDYVYNRSDGCFVAQDGSGDAIYFGEGEGEVYYNFGDYTSDWELGGDNNYYGVSYMGATCLVPVEVKSTPVASITYEPVVRYHVTGYDTVYSVMEGDKVTVTYKEGGSETFIYDPDRTYTYDPAFETHDSSGCFVSQSDSSKSIPWTHPIPFESMSATYDYDTQHYTMTYMGVTDEADEDIAFYAKGFTFEQKNPFRLYEERGDKRTDADGNEYLYFYIYDLYSNGDKVTMNFENAGGEERSLVYTYTGWCFESDESNHSLYPDSFSIEMDPQEDSHLEVGKSYSYGMTYAINDLHLRSTDKPFTIKVVPEEPVEAEDMGSITGLQIKNVYATNLVFDCDDYIDSEGRIPERYQVKAVYNSETVYTASLIKTGPAGLSIYLNQLFQEMDVKANNSYKVDFTFTAISADREILAVSDPISYTFNITGVEKTLTGIDISENVNLGQPLYYQTSLSYQVIYHWNGEGMESGGVQGYEYNVAQVTSVTSSDSSVIEKTDGGLRAVGTGTATITFKYSLNGTTKTKKYTVTVRDQYIQIDIAAEGPINYENLAVGVERNLVLKAYLYKYNTTSKSFVFVGDVTSSTTFSFDSSKSGISGVASTKDKVHATISGNKATIYTDKDMDEGYATFYFAATYGSSVTGEGRYYADISKATKLLVLDDDFLYPYYGNTKVLNPTYMKYENGQTSAITDFNFKVYFENAEVTDVNGVALTSYNEYEGNTEIINSDRLPLTIKNIATSGYSSVRINVVNESGSMESWISVTSNDITTNLTITPLTTSVTYNGEAQEPGVTLSYDGESIPTDNYTVEYYNNTNAGKATIKVYPKNNSYYFTTATFTIAKAPQTITAKAKASTIFVGKSTSITVTGAKEGVTYKSSDTKIATVTTKGVVKGVKAGTVKITVTTAGKNYVKNTKTVTIKVVPASTASLTAANQATGVKLTWKKITGVTGYKVYRGSTLLKKITSASTVTYTDTKANTNGTKYTFKVIPYISTVDGTAKSVITYRLSKPAISSATNSAAGKATIKWGKNTKATGYEIWYSTSKSFSTKKTATITKNTTVSKTLSSLTKGKTYYVKIRTYKTVSGKKYYSAWSAVKTVKITK